MFDPRRYPTDEECVSKLGFPAPKARNAIAQGNALGARPYEWLSAESAQWRVGNGNGDHQGARSALGNLPAPTRADGPGYSISRLWRVNEAQKLVDVPDAS